MVAKEYSNDVVTLEKLQASSRDIYSNSREGMLQLEDVSTNPTMFYEKRDISYSDYKFSSGYNQNGHFISLIGPLLNYAKFSLPINIVTNNEKMNLSQTYTKERPYISLRERILSENQSIDIFVNRIKVDVDKLFITVYDGAIDIYIPRRYFNEGITTNFMYIYINTYKDLVPRAQFTITNQTGSLLTLEDYDTYGMTADPIKYILYRNGRELMYNIDYSIVADDVEKTLAITLVTPLSSGDKFELIFDPDVCLLFSGTINGNIFYVPMKISELTDNYFTPLDSSEESIIDKFPISLSNIDILVNNSKISRSEYSEIMPRIIKMNSIADVYNENFIQYRLRFNINNISTYPDREYRNSLFDFIRYRKSGVSALNCIKSTDAPAWVNNPEYPILSLEKFHYNPIIESVERDKFLVDAINNRIHIDHPDNFKQVLKHFVMKDKEYYSYGAGYTDYIRNDTSQEMDDNFSVTFSSPKVVFRFHIAPELIDYELLVFVNNIKIARDDVSIYSMNNFVSVYVDATLIDATSKVLIWAIPVYNRGYTYLTYDINSTNYTDPIVLTNVESIGIIRDISDIKLFSSNTDNTGSKLLFVDEDYVIVNNLDETYTITLLDDIDSRLIICNGSFTEHETISITDPAVDLERGREIVIDYPHFTSEVIDYYCPRSTAYNILIYLNGHYLTEDVDYYVAKHENNNLISWERIIIHDVINSNDSLEIYFIEKRYEMINYQSYNSNSYAIVYLKNMVIPFDKEYVDVFVNKKLIEPENIDIINSKMIRLKSSEVPLYDVTVRCNLANPITKLNMFIDFYRGSVRNYVYQNIYDGNTTTPPSDNGFYQDTEDEFVNSVLDQYYKEGTPGLDDYIEDHLDEWYAGIYPDTTTNTVNDSQEVIKRSDSFLEYIISDWVSEDVEQPITKIIDCNENYYNRFFAIPKYCNMMTAGEDRLLLLDSNRDNLISANFVINCALYEEYSPSGVDWAVKAVMDYCSDTTNMEEGTALDANYEIQDFEKLDIGSKIHPHEFAAVMMMMNRVLSMKSFTTDKTITVDSNETIVY